MAATVLWRTVRRHLVCRLFTISILLLSLLVPSLRFVTTPPPIKAGPLELFPKVGGQLNGMISDPARHQLFVADKTANAVQVFDEMFTPLKLLTAIPVGTSPFGIGLVDNKVYVANWGSLTEPSSVSVIDAITLNVVANILVNSCNGSAAHVAVNPLTHRVYVSSYGNPGHVAVINSINDSFVGCIPIDRSGTFGIATHPATNFIFVSNRDGLDLWRIDGSGATEPRSVEGYDDGKGGGSPYYVGVNPSSNQLFILVGLPDSNVPNQLFVYDINSNGDLIGAGRVTVGNTHDGGYVLQAQSQCPSNPGLVYVAATADNNVSVLDSNLSLFKTLGTTDGIGAGPFSLAEDPVLGRIYVGNKGDGTISVLDACTARRFVSLSHFLPFIGR